MQLYYIKYKWSMAGLFIAASDQGLVKIDFDNCTDEDGFIASLSQFSITKNDQYFTTIINELDRYFNGERIEFSSPIYYYRGTEFQQSVWNKVKQIPYGETTTYGAIAGQLSRPGAMRAVGAANGSNPLPIVIPCHRVVQTNGNLGGYSAGLEIKDALLRLERAVL